MGWVYAFQNGDDHKVKIGCVRNGEREAVERRRKQLATGNPLRLSLLDLIETQAPNRWETYLHNALRTKKIVGDPKDWFGIAPDVLRATFADARALAAEHATVQEEIDGLEKLEPDGQMKQPGNEDTVLFQEIREIDEEMASLSMQRELRVARLKRSIGRTNGIEGIATWQMYESSKLDEEALRTAYPDIPYEQFTVVTRARKLYLK